VGNTGLKDIMKERSIGSIESTIHHSRKTGGGVEGIHITHTIDITDDMKESVLYEGQPKFSIRRQDGKSEGQKPKVHTKKEAKKLTDKGENKLQLAYRKFIDRQHPFARTQKLQGKTDADKDIMKLATNAVKARGTSQYILSDSLVNRLCAETDTAGTTGDMIIDIHKNGATIMATNKIKIATTATTSTTHGTQPDLSVTTFAAGDIIEIFIDQNHTTKAIGLTVYMAVQETL
jgi:hypothetical protein